MSLHLLWKVKSLDVEFRYFYYGVAVFLLSFMVARVLFFINEITFEGKDLSLKQGMYYNIGSSLSAIAILGLSVIVEKYVYSKLHYIPSFIILISVILTIFLPKISEINMITYYTYVWASCAIIFVFVYFYIGLKTRGDIRKKSFIIVIGLILQFIGNLLNTGLLKERYPMFRVFSPITILISFIIIHYGFLLFKIEKLPSMDDIGINKSTLSMIKTLGLDLTRPEKITEEEVRFYKEQTICVVCKGALGRYNVYLCPECKVLYCVKCSKTLTELENACWVCDTPFDESKPVKLPEKDIQAIEIREAIQKESKKK
jgi:uncharacterized membrane protein